MLLRDLLKNINYEIIQGNVEININNISSDSRKIQTNDLFVCLSGEKTDGHNFINQITTSGAILIEKNVTINNTKQTIIKVENSRKTFAYLMSNFYNHPENDLDFIGITGTNGKTSTTIIIESILQFVKQKCAVLGSINNRINEKEIPIKITTSTTPDIHEFFEILNYIKEQNVKNVIMEVTSHALSLYRVETINFTIAIFTNLTQDHLDYHKTMEAYKEAKFKLFKQAKKAVINIDDDCGKDFFNRIQTEKMSISLKNQLADLYAYNTKITADGSYFDLKYKNKEYKNIFINLVGAFSIYNVLGCIGACLFKNIAIDDILEAIKYIHKVAGRCEKIAINKDFTVIVDFAHTPDALENILKTAREFTTNRLISIFGCGGNRDTTKRAIMGKISTELADLSIITSDNPRDENPESIIKEIEQGIKNDKYQLIVARHEAIIYALKNAKAGDVLVIAGKGHENYQEFENKRKVHFSDVEEVNNFFK